MIKQVFTYITLIFTITACSSAPPLTGELAVFNWLQHANASEDAKQAISAQDFRLIAIASRGQAIPGIDANTARRAKQNCKVKYVQGLGDNKGKGEYTTWWQKALHYAKAYNRSIISYCVN